MIGQLFSFRFLGIILKWTFIILYIATTFALKAEITHALISVIKMSPSSTCISFATSGLGSRLWLKRNLIKISYCHFSTVHSYYPAFRLCNLVIFQFNLTVHLWTSYLCTSLQRSALLAYLIEEKGKSQQSSFFTSGKVSFFIQL